MSGKGAKNSALELKRKFIGYEINENYVNLAKNRIKEFKNSLFY